jgi:hypothetical protein
MYAKALNKVKYRKRCKRAKEKSPLAFPLKYSLSLALVLALDNRHCRSLPKYLLT